jgi:hypothetical protein
LLFPPAYIIVYIGPGVDPNKLVTSIILLDGKSISILEPFNGLKLFIVISDKCSMELFINIGLGGAGVGTGYGEL